MKDEYKEYENRLYGLKLKYPSNWVKSKITSDKFQGGDGFFQVALISSDNDIDKVAYEDAYHFLKPYGSSPKITEINVDDHNARLIVPTTKENGYENTMSSVIIQLNKSHIINGIRYNYLIVWVDSNHIQEIIKTIIIND